MKEKIINLANKLKFTSEILSSSEWKYSNKESLRYYLWLCELNRWLMAVHGCYVTIMVSSLNTPDKVEWVYMVNIIDKPYADYISMGYNSPDSALESAILSIMEKIDNNFNNALCMNTNIKITRSNIGEHLFDYQLGMVGKTRLDTIDDDKWRFNITMTRAQREEFKKYAIPLLMKTFRFTKKKALYNFEWFLYMFGLRLKG